MDTTRNSLLVRLRNTGDNQSWNEFYSVYEPFLMNMARRLGLNDQDASDVVAEVLSTCVRVFPDFEHDRARGFFRGWLKTLVRNKVNDLWRRNQKFGKNVPLEAGVEPATNEDIWRRWDEEYRQRILEAAMESVRDASEAKTWACFELHIVERRRAADVAAELGMKTNAVYANASRTVKRIRDRCLDFDEEIR